MNEKKFIYEPIAYNEALSSIKSIINDINTIMNDINSGNNYGGCQCNMKNIKNASNNCENVKKELNNLHTSITESEKKIKELFEKQYGIDFNESEMFSLTTSDDSSELNSRELEGFNKDGNISDKITLQEMKQIVNDASEWTSSEKDKEILQLYYQMYVQYYTLANDSTKMLNNFVEMTFETVNVGFDEKKGETYKTAYGKRVYETKEEKLTFFKSQVTAEISYHLTNNVARFDMNYEKFMELLNDSDVPEEFSHIPQGFWDNAIVDNGNDGETAYNRALLILSMSSNPKEDIGWFRKKVQNELRVGIQSQNYQKIVNSNGEKFKKQIEYQEQLNLIENELVMETQMLDSMRHLLNNSINEYGELKQGEELCQVFNESYKKILDLMEDDDLTRDPFERIFKETNIKKEKSDQAWFEVMKEFFPEQLTMNELPSDNTSIEYKTYKNSYGSMDMLLYIRNTQGDEGVTQFLNSYYQKCGGNKKINNEFISLELDLLEDRNIRLNNVCLPIVETANKINEISLFEKNIIDESAKQLEISLEVSNDPNKRKKFANSLGIDVKYAELFQDYQIDAYLELKDGDRQLYKRYGEILNEIVIDYKARKNAQAYVKNTLVDTGIEFIDLNLLGLQSTYNMLSSLTLGAENFGYDIANVIFYDGKVSERELTQRYIMEYYSNDYSMYKDYDSELNQIMLNDFNIENLEFLDSVVMTEEQIYNLATKLSEGIINDQTYKTYDLFYELVLISREDYLKYLTLANTAEEELEWYDFLAEKGLKVDTQKIIHQTGTGVGYMAVPIGLSAIGHPTAGNVLLSLAQAGSSMEQLAQSGETNRGTIAVYGALNALKSFAVERMGGFFSPSGKNIIDVEGFLGKFSVNGKKLPNTIINLFANSGDEMLEEVVELYLGYGLDSYFNQDAVPDNFNDVLNETVDTMWQTFLTTPLLGGYSQGISGKVNAQRNVNNLFCNYNLSFGDIIMYTDFNGNIKYKELYNHIINEGKSAEFYSPDVVKANFNEKYGQEYILDAKFEDGVYTLNTKDGLVMKYDAFGNLINMNSSLEMDKTTNDVTIDISKLDSQKSSKIADMCSSLLIALDKGKGESFSINFLEKDTFISRLIKKDANAIKKLCEYRNAYGQKYYDFHISLMAANDIELARTCASYGNYKFVGKMFDIKENYSAYLEIIEEGYKNGLCTIAPSASLFLNDSTKSKIIELFPYYAKYCSLDDFANFMSGNENIFGKINLKQIFSDYKKYLEYRYGELLFDYSTVNLNYKTDIATILNFIEICELRARNSREHVFSSYNDFLYFYGSEFHGNYGVDQGFFKRYKFADDGRAVLGTNNDVEYYINILIEKKYTREDAEIVLQTIDSQGACSYAATCNMIFNQYKDNPQKFKEDFGYDMIIDVNGQHVLNSGELLLELYEWTNSSKSKDGNLFLYDKHNNSYRINEEIGIKPVDLASHQQYFSDSVGYNIKLFNEFLKYKGVNVKYKSNKKHIEQNNIKSLINEVEQGLADGKEIMLSVGNGVRVFYNNFGNNQNIKGGHAMYIIGVTDAGFVVSSWGMKCIVPFMDLYNTENGVLNFLEPIK